MNLLAERVVHGGYEEVVVEEGGTLRSGDTLSILKHKPSNFREGGRLGEVRHRRVSRCNEVGYFGLKEVDRRYVEMGEEPRKVEYDGGIEYNWLVDHPEETVKYAGEYIAIVGERIVAHGSDFLEVAKEAKKVAPRPLFHKVPTDEVMVI